MTYLAVTWEFRGKVWLELIFGTTLTCRKLGYLPVHHARSGAGLGFCMPFSILHAVIYLGFG